MTLSLIGCKHYCQLADLTDSQRYPSVWPCGQITDPNSKTMSFSDRKGTVLSSYDRTLFYLKIGLRSENFSDLEIFIIEKFKLESRNKRCSLLIKTGVPNSISICFSAFLNQKLDSPKYKLFRFGNMYKHFNSLTSFIRS